MYLTVSYETKDNITVEIAVNMNNLVSIGDCQGKKKEEDGYKSVLYTPNGHALYSRLDRATLVAAIQGKEFTEDFIEQAVAAQQAEQAPNETETH